MLCIDKLSKVDILISRNGHIRQFQWITGMNLYQTGVRLGAKATVVDFCFGIKNILQKRKFWFVRLKNDSVDRVSTVLEVKLEL